MTGLVPSTAYRVPRRWYSVLVTLHFVAFALWLTLGARLFSVEAMARAVDGWLLVQHGQASPAALLLPPLATALALPISILPGLGGIAANVVSALAASLAALALGRVLGLIGVGRALRAGLVLAFLANPLVWLAGANGAGEMLFVALVLLAIEQSLQLMRGREAPFQAVVALGFLAGLIVLARYAGLVLLPIWLFAVRHAASGLPDRSTGREAYQLVFALPAIFVIGLWLLTSLIVSGDPVYWITHQAETALRLGVGDPILARATGTAVEIATPTTILSALVEQLFTAHVVFTVLLVPLGIATWRRRPGASLVLGVAGSLILAIAVSALFRQQPLQLRDLLLLVPLTLIAIGVLVGGKGAKGEGRRAKGEGEKGALQYSPQPSAFNVQPSTPRPPFAFRLSPFALRLSPFALLLVLPLLMGMAMLASDDVGEWPREFLLSLAGRSRPIWRAEEQIARVVVDRPLARDVLADDLVTHRIIFLSGRPDRFVTRADPAFDRVVALPAGKVSAVLVPAPALGDAVSRRYPGLYELGADWAVAEQHWPGVGWRLFSVPGRPGALEPAEVRR